MVAVPVALSRSKALRPDVLDASSAGLEACPTGGAEAPHYEVRMSKSRVLGEFFRFLKQEKKYWLVPIVVVFVLFGLLIVFSQSSAVAPFIYTLF
jgi:hypothetical protein